MGRPVEPMFVVVGDDTSEVLATYGRNVARVSRLLAPKLVDRILKAQDPELLQQLGELHLNLTDAKQFDERLTNSKEGGVSGVLD